MYKLPVWYPTLPRSVSAIRGLHGSIKKGRQENIYHSRPQAAILHLFATTKLCTNVRYQQQGCSQLPITPANV